MCGPLAPIQLFVDGSVEGIAHHPVRERERIVIATGQRGGKNRAALHCVLKAVGCGSLCAKPSCRQTCQFPP